MTADLAETYRRDGVVATTILSTAEAGEHRAALDAGEAVLGPLHYRDKVHTVMMSPFELATHPTVLDVVESLIGPDILLYNSTYIIKEPGTETYVSWHQDLTYWGLEDDDAQVSMWLALAPATVESGCMSMIPGSHLNGPAKHNKAPDDADNVLLLGQRIEDVDTSAAIAYPLAPGEASFHHGWTVHASGHNTSTDRRIGLNVQYLAPHNRQVSGDAMSAMVARGTDSHNNFGVDVAPARNLDPVAVERWEALDDTMKTGFQAEGPTGDP